MCDYGALNQSVIHCEKCGKHYSNCLCYRQFADKIKKHKHKFKNIRPKEKK